MPKKIAQQIFDTFTSYLSLGFYTLANYAVRLSASSQQLCDGGWLVVTIA